MKKIYILPNLFTSANFFCGILSLTLALDGKYSYAAIAILAGIFFDILDGPIARWNKSTSKFGLEYDSLSDLITFGVAPMVLLYRMVLCQLGAHGRIGLGIAFLYSVCAALRLARYNTRSNNRGAKKQFMGLPTPSAAGFLSSYVLLLSYYGVADLYLKYVPVLMIGVSYLMVSNIAYPSAINPHMLRKKPFIYLVAALLILASITLFVHEAIFLGFTAFIVHAPFLKLFRRWNRRRKLEMELQEDFEQGQRD